MFHHPGNKGEGVFIAEEKPALSGENMGEPSKELSVPDLLHFWEFGLEKLSWGRFGTRYLYLYIKVLKA